MGRRKKAEPAAEDPPAEEPCTRIVETIEWDGVTIEVRYEPEWLGTKHAHLELQAISPPRAKLPVTETGYRSHFLAKEEVEALGGPGAFAKAWLEQEAKRPAWRKAEAAARQLSLF